ncbi:MAG: InlB B-repeat-containing protein [Tannerellaceae bacterium]|jgi:predicted outer membrane repeat protein|nr:InlB B-repeat-containing protein [Tannerellaceae bacterium]
MKRFLFLFLLTGDVFGAIHTVQTAETTGPGSFPQALLEAASGDTILFELSDGSLSPVVVLPASLPSNTKNLLIEGNGVTLSGGTVRARTFHNAAGATVVFRRTHFTSGYLVNEGKLRLESCILSANRSPDGKGALWNNNGNLTVQACTFFENTSAHHGAAIYTEGDAAEAAFTGCLFLHNMSEEGISIFRASGKITSGGYNIFDYEAFKESDGFYHEADLSFPAYTSAEPVYWFSPVSFRVMQNYYTYFLARIALPLEDYPKTDFYGAPVQPVATMEGKAFSGAVQSLVKSQNGYVLHYILQGNDHLTVETSTGGKPDEDGLFPPGTIVLLKDKTPNAITLSWTVNGETRQPASLSEGLEVYMTGHQRVELTICRQRLVTQLGDDGEGSLRQALISMQDYDVVQFADGLKGKTISLKSKLPTLTNLSIRIEATELTLTGNDYPLLTFHGASATVQGIRFIPPQGSSHAGNNGAGEGGVVFNNGSELTLHSCIFSGHALAASGGDGGALYNAGGKMTVKACTFYNNTAFRGGAIYNTGELELEGNIFSANRAVAPDNGQTLFNTGRVMAAYNLYDTVSYGFSFDTKNRKIATMPFSPVSFELTPELSLTKFSPSSPYPATDYYGKALEASVYPGAVKQNHPVGFILTWEVFGQGQIELVEGPMPTVAHKLVPAESVITLRATPTGVGDERMICWEVNGRQTSQADNLTLTVRENTSVRAVFNRIYTVTTLTDNPNGGQGTFRNYLFTGWQADGDIIRFADDLAGKIFTLSTNLPPVTHKITVEGNGITFDGHNLSSPMLSVNTGAELTISRIRFTGCSLPETPACDGGTVFFNQGRLALNNCIFDDNHADAFAGGAIYSTGFLLATACTFYGNSAKKGGALCIAQGVSLTVGNLFCNNTAQTTADIYEALPLKNIHRLDQYLNESVIDPLTFIPNNADRLQVSYPDLASFGFPAIDFYHVLRNTRTTTSVGAAVLATAVSFDTHDGGVTSFPSRIVERGSFLNEPAPEIQRPDYLFEGWFEDSIGTYRWNFDLRPTTTDSLLLHAKWQSLRTAYVVTFRLANGQPDSLVYVLPSTGILAPPQDPLRPYYTFAGWFANQECTLPWDFQTLITSSTTIYAGWTPLSFQVTFEPSNGSPPIVLTTLYNSVLTPPAIIPIGLSSVIGWRDDTLSVAMWNFETMHVTSDTTLYAVWAPPLQTISLLHPAISLTPTVFTHFVRLQAAGGYQLAIFNAAGALLLSRKLDSDDDFIDTSAFSSGIYFFSLSYGKERILFKAIRP